MQIRDLANRFDKYASRSPRASRAAALVRNQCNMILGYHLAPSAQFDRNGEEWLQQRLAQRVTRFVDVGANRGDWSAGMLEANPSAVGIAVEAGEEACSQLGSRALPGLTVVHAAAGDTTGTVTFFEQPGAGEWSSLSAAHAGDAVGRTVPMVTVDQLLADRDWDTLDLLKIDAEGWDLRVLQGARETLAAQRVAFVQFEYGPAWVHAGCTLKAAIDYLRGHGYSVAALRADGLMPYAYEEFGEFFQYSNFVACTEASRRWLPA